MPQSSEGLVSAMNSPRKQSKPSGRPAKKSSRVCHICGRSFSKSEHLLRHTRSHTNERPFTCVVWGKSFSRTDTLRRHGKSHEAWRASQPSSLSDDVLEQPPPNKPDGYSAVNQHDVPPPTIDASPQEIIPPINSVLTPQGPALTDPVPGDPAIHSNAENQPYDSPYISPIDAGLWDTQLADSWVLARDFDVGALDSALDTSISEWALPENNNNFLSEPQFFPPPQQVLRSQGAPPDLGEFNSPGDEKVRAWRDGERQVQIHTVGDTLTGFTSQAASEGPGEALYVDEQYRDSLSSKLRPRQYGNTQLSVDHLNQCLRLYLKRFHPIFPVVHPPTFRPNSCNALLFLSMCSIGSLFIGSPEGIAQGHGIFTRLHKAILASWETHLSGSKSEALCMVQAALLGQTFGTLSRRSNDIVMTDAFQGTMIVWARKVHAFEPFET
ncbi:hypothetical protein BDW59DRAFT_165143 [Aspergillus cavernicola]|uniref:C2H2-type domain-containing protein n=1 Tax=Aspergillus cavernicola TaxID=176166 RepID=A0ABR4HUY0_9EURO